MSVTFKSGGGVSELRILDQRTTTLAKKVTDFKILSNRKFSNLRTSFLTEVQLVGTEAGRGN